MSGAYRYKPKFVDIRIRPPKPEDEAREADVHGLKPGERRCEWPDCLRAGEARAPKSRDLPDQHYWFCQAHAGEYNRNWNFFAGMSEDAQARFREDALTGHRPTWQFKASRFSREAASTSARGAAAFADPLGVLAAARRRAEAASAAAAARKMGKLEIRALAEMDLEVDADAAAIRTRYLDMVKRFHPDSNGGDRSSEQKLTRVLKAYKTLKAAKLV